MFNVQDLKNATTPRQPLGTVPWILEDDGSGRGIPIGIGDDGYVDFHGTGFILFDAPVYPLSSSQRLQWESRSQRVLVLLVGDNKIAGSEIFEEQTIGTEGGETEGKAPEMSQESKVALMGAMATNAEKIRSLQSEMLEVAIRMPIGSHSWIATVTGLGADGTDLFSQAFQAVSEMLTPKAAAVDPNDEPKAGRKSKS